VTSHTDKLLARATTRWANLRYHPSAIDIERLRKNSDGNFGIPIAASAIFCLAMLR